MHLNSRQAGTKIVDWELGRNNRWPMAEKWIQKSGVSQNKGGLHRALGVPSEKPIPAGKLSSALHSSNSHLMHMARFAANVKGLKKPKVKKLFSASRDRHEDSDGDYDGD